MEKFEMPDELERLFRRLMAQYAVRGIRINKSALAASEEMLYLDDDLSFSHKLAYAFVMTGSACIRFERDAIICAQCAEMATQMDPVNLKTFCGVECQKNFYESLQADH